MSHDQYISKGYVPVTDSSIISQLQQGALDTSTFKDTSQWQNWLNQNAGLVTPLSQAEIDAAKQRLAAYDAYESGASGGPVIALSDTNRSNTLNTSGSAPSASDPQQYVEELKAAQIHQQQYVEELKAAQIRQQQYIEELKEAQIQQQIAALDKAKSNALSALADEEAGLKPQYYDEKNRAAARSDVSDLNFAQFMASRGIQGSAGGANQMYSNAALQGQIGALDRQEQAARDRIARSRTGIENAYQSDVAAARAGAEAQALQAAIDQMNADKLFSLQEAALTGQYQGRPTMQGQQSQAEQLERQASLLAAQYYDNIAGYINTLDPNDPIIPYLHVKRREKINIEAEKAAFAAAAKSEAEQQAWNNAFKLFQEVGGITSPEQAQILGLPPDATVADIDIARINAATSRMNAQTARKNAETAATATTSTNSLDSYVDYIKANFGTNKSQISAYLESLMTAGVDDAIVNALAEKYGL
jgi:hypothetical protein